MRIFCFQYKIMPIEYFMDRMEWYEVNNYIENLEYLDTNSWEQMRTLVYSITSMFSKKHYAPTDLMKFAWDKEKNNDKITEISNEDIEKLQYQANQIKRKHYGG